jgi:ABC-type multidrug transport system fused ATPase/permease subunit
LQQGAIQIKTNLAVATETLNLWSRINSSDVAIEAKLPDYSAAPSVFSPSVSLKNVSFRYPGAEDFTIKDINLEILPGEMVAIAGSSGAGKSTLVDLILGVLEPTHGEALLSNIPPSVALRSFTGRISYVPQDVLIINGTIKSNVALGYPEEEVSDDQVWESLRAAHLDIFVSQLPEGILHVIGERGTNLSGGQRQRLGLARVRGSITLIVIAHRLSTIRDAERILYLKGGVVAAEGSFMEVENLIPEFGSSTIK